MFMLLLLLNLCAHVLCFFLNKIQNKHLQKSLPTLLTTMCLVQFVL